MSPERSGFDGGVHAFKMLYRRGESDWRDTAMGKNVLALITNIFFQKVLAGEDTSHGTKVIHPALPKPLNVSRRIRPQLI